MKCGWQGNDSSDVQALLARRGIGKNAMAHTGKIKSCSQGYVRIRTNVPNMNTKRPQARNLLD
jgi:hypothetical protein